MGTVGEFSSRISDVLMKFESVSGLIFKLIAGYCCQKSTVKSRLTRHFPDWIRQKFDISNVHDGRNINNMNASW